MKKRLFHTGVKDEVADAINKEGAPAYEMTLDEKLRGLLYTGSVGNTFYASANENLDTAVAILNEVKDPKMLADMIVDARNEGFMRTMPIAALVRLSVLDVALFRSTAQKVLQNPHDWKQFIDICRSKKIRKGVGRGIKRLMLQEIAKTSEYHAVKYTQAFRDMVNIARPEATPITKYVKTGEPTTEYFSALKGLNAKNADKLIEKYKFPYEAIVSQVNPTPWEALFKVAPYMNLIRNLSNFAEDGVFNTDFNLQVAVKRITNDASIEKSRMFPYAFYLAHENVRAKGKVAKELQIALAYATEKSLVNVPEFKQDIAVFVDVSSSMTSNATGDKSVVQVIDIAGLFASAIFKKNPEATILSFNESAHIINLSEEQSLIDNAATFAASGGTNMSAPMEYLLNNEIKVDAIIGITDNQSWVDSNYWYDSRKEPTSFNKLLQEYRERINPEARAYLVTVISYGTKQTPSADRLTNYVFGWNDSVFKYIAWKEKQYNGKPEPVVTATPAKRGRGRPKRKK